MALIALPPRHLQLHSPLPFRVFDAKGMLMLAGGAAIEQPERLQSMRAMTLYVEEDEARSWLEQASQTVQSLMLRNAPLQDIAVARWREGEPSSALTREGLRSAQPTAPSALPERLTALNLDSPLVERFDSAMRLVHGVLREGNRNAGWLERLHLAVTVINSLAETYPNQLLFLLIQHASHETRHYSSHHAVLCTVICTRVADALKWSLDDVQTLSLAATTMNLSMTALQDQLAAQKETVSPAQRELIDSHALRSAAELAALGVKDPRWLKVVRLHHDPALTQAPLAKLDAPGRMARLLGVVDRFTAKISRRATRAPMSPLAAARAACVGADGRPDELGSALLKALGMYPPGSSVQLANGEIGVVMARGGKANEPFVAVLVNSSGMALPEPVLRDTSLAGRSVTGAVAVDQVRVRIDHARLIELL